MALRVRCLGPGWVPVLNIEREGRARTFNVDIEMFGPFLGVNLYF